MSADETTNLTVEAESEGEVVAFNPDTEFKNILRELNSQINQYGNRRDESSDASKTFKGAARGDLQSYRQFCSHNC